MEIIIKENSLPLVRVIILNYNQSHYTIASANFIRNQNYNNIQIIVVDNNSCKEELIKLQNDLPESVQLIISEHNLGYAKGNNLGCKLATKIIPDYYFIINNDIFIKDNHLISKLVGSLMSRKKDNIVAVSPLVNTISSGIPIEKQIQVRKLLPTYKQIIVNSPFLNKLFFSIFNDYVYKTKMPYIEKEVVVDTINGAAFMIDGTFFRKNNFFDEGTFLFNEEIILGKQIQQLGCTCLLNGKTSIDHLQGISTKSNKRSYNTKMEKEKLKSEIYYLSKYLAVNNIYLFIIKTFRLLEIFILKFIKSI